MTYDASADAAYMYLTGREPSVGESRSRFSSMTEINFQRSSSTFKDGLLVGVEVLGAKVGPPRTFSASPDSPGTFPNAVAQCGPLLGG